MLCLGDLLSRLHKATSFYAFFAYLALVADDLVELLTSLDVGRQRDGGTDQGQGERRRGIHGSKEEQRGRGQYTPVSGLDKRTKKRKQSEYLSTQRDACAPRWAMRCVVRTLPNVVNFLRWGGQQRRLKAASSNRQSAARFSSDRDARRSSEYGQASAMWCLILSATAGCVAS